MATAMAMTQINDVNFKNACKFGYSELSKIRLFHLK
jgi:hypothetical protein